MIDLDLTPPRPAARRAVAAPLPTARPMAAAAVLLVLLVTLGGSASPRPNLTPVRALGDLAAGQVALTPQALFTATPGGEPDSASVIRRYALPDGSRQWATGARYSVRRLQLSSSGDILVATSGQGPELLFLDAGTGRALWRSNTPNTLMLSLTATRVLLISNDAGGGGALLRLADLRTGAVVWSRRVPSAARIETGGPSGGPVTRIVVVSADGRASVLGFADGTERAAADLGVQLLPFENDGRSDYADVTAVDDRVYVARRSGGDTTLAAYAVDGLRLLWRVGGREVGQLSGCGGLLCLTGERALTVLDKRDGSVRWTDPRWRFGLDDPLSDGRAGPSRVLALGRQDDREAALLDAATGRVVRSLGQSRYVGALVLRADTRIPKRIWVSVGVPGGEPHLIGSLDNAGPYDCAAAGEFLACPTSSGVTGVWRVPASRRLG